MQGCLEGRRSPRRAINEPKCNLEQYPKANPWLYRRNLFKRPKTFWILITYALDGLKKQLPVTAFLGWFVGLVVPLQEIFVLPWLV
jgi:hypothetical protein